MLIMLAAHSALALDPAREMRQFKHTAWSFEDGAPASITTMTQASDGYLWLGTASGLYRFDGLVFESISQPIEDHPPSKAVMSLLAAKNGDIWVGYLHGGLGIYRNGILSAFNHGPPTGVVNAILQDSDSAVWVATDGNRNTRVSRFSQGKWDEGGNNWGLPRAHFQAMLAPRDGTVWIALNNNLMVLRHGSRNFEFTSVKVSQDVHLAEDPGGNVWMSDPEGVHIVTLPSAHDLKGTPVNETYGSYLLHGQVSLFDTQGSFWSGEKTGGLVRVRHPSMISENPISSGADTGSYTRKDGLTSNTVESLLEDREGNIWAGTSSGLDRFRAADIVAEPSMNSPDDGPEGFFLAGYGPGPFYEINDRRVFHVTADGISSVATDPDVTHHVCAEDSDGLLTAGTDGLGEQKGGLVTAIKLPVGLEHAFVRSCSMDSNGNIWVSIPRGGLFRLGPDGWERHDINKELALAIPLLLKDGGDGSVIVYYGLGSLFRVDASHAERLCSAQELPPGLVNVLYNGRNGLLIGGEAGLVRYHDGRCQVLRSSRFTELENVGGIVQTSAGETWLLGHAGVVKLSTQELDETFDHPDHGLHAKVFGTHDGLQGNVEDLYGPKAAEGPDGRLWFATAGGVAWIDPKHLRETGPASPVILNSLVANGILYLSPIHLSLPAGVSNLQIAYRSLDLSDPGRIQFRYRLDGVDRNWVDAGSRREAFYTQIGPGSYRFHVIAANNDGVWNTHQTVLAFSIQPTFIQSITFKVLCAIAAAGCLWFLYTIRARQIAGHIRAGLEERLTERERIARDLHDTLLQGFQGLMLRFQAALDSMKTDQPGRRLLEDALVRADDVLVDGRDRVQDLRITGAGNLAEILRLEAESLAIGRRTKIRLVIEGVVRELHPIVQEELFRIGVEAISNAFQHANAEAIDVNIIYLRQQMCLRVCDDGVGLDSGTLAAGGREHHFGLTGMRERATRIRATFALLSRPGLGCEVEVTVPSRVAYRHLSKRSWHLGFRDAGAR